MGWKQQVTEAKAGKTAIFPAPGTYDLEVLAVKEHTKQSTNEELFIVEFKVLASSNPTRPVGSTMDWVLTMRYPSSPADAKRFVEVASECKSEEVTDDALSYIVGPDQPLVGVKLKVTFFNKVTKGGKDFTKAKFEGRIGAAAAA